MPIPNSFELKITCNIEPKKWRELREDGYADFQMYRIFEIALRNNIIWEGIKEDTKGLISGDIDIELIRPEYVDFKEIVDVG